MRANVEQVKAAVLYPDVEVRESAVCYFRNSPEVDTTIMSLVIRAYQQYGRDAFSIPNVWSDLPQTPETLDWVTGQLNGLGPASSEIDERFEVALVEALFRTGASLLQPQLDRIKAIVTLDEESQEIIEERVHLSTFRWEQLWSELLEFCEAREGDEEICKADSEFASTVVEHLSHYPTEVTPKVLGILRVSDGSHGYLLDDLVVELAGRLRLEDAIPLLITRLGDADVFSSEAAHRALELLGTNAVVSEIGRRYADADLEFRLAMATTLEDIHTDFSVSTCLDLYARERDVDIQGLLLQAALMNFSTEAIEHARLFVLNQPKSPDQLEVRTALLTACKVLGETIPEFQDWLKDSKSDTEFRRQWYKDHPLNWADDEVEEHALFEDGALDEERDDGSETATVRNDQGRIGRNDPCPCGSGKKYKKCCGRHGQAESDEQHATVMSRSPHKRETKYPIGTLANYGPDDETTTKIVAAVIRYEGAEPILERWVGSRITQNPKAQRQVREFLERHRVNSVVVSEGNMGCPHEEGLDFPLGGDCPFCPFWAGKQGSKREL